MHGGAGSNADMVHVRELAITERLQLQSILNDKQVASSYPTAARLAIGYPAVRWSNKSSIGTKLIADKD